jgi:hypothetical protein
MSVFRAALITFAILPLNANAVDWAFSSNEVVSLVISGTPTAPTSQASLGTIARAASDGFSSQVAFIYYGEDLISDAPSTICRA